MEKLNEAKNRLHKTTEEFLEAIDAICKDYESKQEPEFKIGQWAGFKIIDGKIYPFLIHHFEGDKVYGQDFKCESDIYRVIYQCNKGILLCATPKEIESHLRKICDKKYIGKKYITAFETGGTQTFPDNPNYHYDINRDSFDCGNGYGFLYFQGKFAEIIPDKKKRPETRDEFRELINHITLRYFDDVLIEKEMDDLLDQYDI